MPQQLPFPFLHDLTGDNARETVAAFLGSLDGHFFSHAMASAVDSGWVSRLHAVVYDRYMLFFAIDETHSLGDEVAFGELAPDPTGRDFAPAEARHNALWIASHLAREFMAYANWQGWRLEAATIYITSATIADRSQHAPGWQQRRVWVVDGAREPALITFTRRLSGLGRALPFLWFHFNRLAPIVCRGLNVFHPLAQYEAERLQRESQSAAVRRHWEEARQEAEELVRLTPRQRLDRYLARQREESIVDAALHSPECMAAERYNQKWERLMRPVTPPWDVTPEASK